MSARQLPATKIIAMLKKGLSSYPGYIDSQLSHVADLIEEDAQEHGKRRTGNMVNKTTKKRLNKGGNIGYEVSGTAEYTVYVHAKYPYIFDAFNKYKPMLSKIDIKGLFSGGNVGGGGGGTFNAGWD